MSLVMRTAVAQAILVFECVGCLGLRSFVMAAVLAAVGAGQEGGVPPVPPYSAADDASAGIECYICKMKGLQGWGRTLEHIRKKHGFGIAQFRGTFLYDKANEELNKARRGRRAESTKPKAAKVKKESGGSGAHAAVQATSNCGGGGVPTPMQGESEKAAGAQQEWPDRDADDTVLRDADGRVVREPDGCYWKAMFVKMAPDGTVHQPIEVNEAAPGGREMTADPVHAHQEPTASCEPMSVPMLSLSPSTPSPMKHVGSSPDHSPTAAMEEIKGLIADLRPKRKSAWKDDLPQLRLTPSARECTLPAVKGELDGVRRAAWPKELPVLEFDLHDFETYMVGDKMLKKGTRTLYILNVKRVFSLVEVNRGDGVFQPPQPEEMKDVKLLSAFAINNFAAELLDLPLLDFKYSWSSDVLDALVAFCKWQLHVVSGHVVEGDDGHWGEYNAAINRLLAILGGGHRKKSALAKVGAGSAMRCVCGYELCSLGVVRLVHLWFVECKRNVPARDGPKGHQRSTSEPCGT